MKGIHITFNEILSLIEQNKHRDYEKSGLHKISILTFLAPVLFCSLFSCKKFVETNNPKNELVKSTVFDNDETANGAIAGLYAQLAKSGYACGNISSVSYVAGQSADELVPGSNGPSEFYNNSILVTSGTILLSLWNTPYNQIFTANSIIEGLSSTTKVSASLKQQLIGEAKFIRAFTNFYLVNLYGDIPLILTTDYRTNSNIPKSPKADVYNQIISDLKDAITLLADDYSFSNGEKVRANKWVAKALLARVYLYTGDYVDAETESSAVINNNALFSLSALSKVFLANSPEAIWQLTLDNQNTPDATNYVPSTTNIPINATLRPSIVSSFDTADQRKKQWIISSTVLGTTYYYPAKYKAYKATPITEYSMVIRLAEMYLIRAEARLKQGEIIGASGAESDIDIIRTRAGLSPTTATTAADMMTAIENERVFELFTEWGHRWFDLKRWPSKNSPGDITLSRADDVLQTIKSPWNKNVKLYPIPQSQILNDPAMANAQNPGY